MALFLMSFFFFFTAVHFKIQRNARILSLQCNQCIWTNACTSEPYYPGKFPGVPSLRMPVIKNTANKMSYFPLIQAIFL